MDSDSEGSLPHSDEGNEDATERTQRDRAPPTTMHPTGQPAQPPQDKTETCPSENVRQPGIPTDMLPQASHSSPVQQLTQSRDAARQFTSTRNTSLAQVQERLAPESHANSQDKPLRSPSRVEPQMSTQRGPRTSFQIHGGQTQSQNNADFIDTIDLPLIFPALPTPRSFPSYAPGEDSVMAATRATSNSRANARQSCLPEQQRPPNNNVRSLGTASPPLLPLFLDDYSRPPIFDVIPIPPPPFFGAGPGLFLPPLPAPSLPQSAEPSIPPLLGIGTIAVVIGDRALATLLNSTTPLSSNLPRPAEPSTGHFTPVPVAQPTDSFVSSIAPATTIELDIPFLSSQGRLGLVNTNTDPSIRVSDSACTCNVLPEAAHARGLPEQQRSSSNNFRARSHTSLPQFPLLLEDSVRPPFLDALMRPPTPFQGTAPRFFPPPFQPPRMRQPTQPTIHTIDVGSVVLIIGDQALATMVNSMPSVSSNQPTAATAQSGPMGNYFPDSFAAGNDGPPTAVREAPTNSAASTMPVTTIEVDIPLFDPGLATTQRGPMTNFPDRLTAGNDEPPTAPREAPIDSGASAMPVTTIELDIPLLHPVLADTNTVAPVDSSSSPGIFAPILTIRSPVPAGWSSPEGTTAEILRPHLQSYTSDGTPNMTANSMAPDTSAYSTSQSTNSTSVNNYFSAVPIRVATPTATTSSNSPPAQGAGAANTSASSPSLALDNQTVPIVMPVASASRPSRYRFAVNITHSSPSTTPIVRVEGQPLDSPPPPVSPRPAVRSRTHMHSTQRQL